MKSDDPLSFQQLFGALRSALGAHLPDETLSLVRRARQLDIARYEQEWWPYLEESWRQKDFAAFDLHGFAAFEQMMAALPFAQVHLTLNKADNLSQALQALDVHPHASQISALTLDHCRFKRRDIKTLAHAPFMASLETLCARANNLGAQGFITLCHDADLPRLHTLTIAQDTLGAAGATKLAQRWTSLRTLELDGAELYDDGLIALVSSNPFAHLHTLRLPSNHITDVGITAFAHGAALTTLQELDLSQNPLTPEGVRTLMESMDFPSLTRLVMGQIHVGTKGARALARSGITAQLELLDLSHTRTGIPAYRILFDKDIPWNIDVLRLSGTSFNDEAMELLLQSQAFDHLRELDVSGTRMSAEAVHMLLDDPRCASLHTLRLTYPGSDKTTRAIAQCAALSNLHTLDLCGTWTSQVAYQALLDSPFVSQAIPPHR